MQDEQIAALIPYLLGEKTARYHLTEKQEE